MKIRDILRESRDIMLAPDGYKPSEEFIRALESYTQGAATDLAKDLEHQSVIDTANSIIRAFDAGMPAMAYSETVYRGGNFPNSKPPPPEADFRTQDRLRMRDYFSTSFSFAVAERFMLETIGEPVPDVYYLMEIKTLAGARGISVDEFVWGVHMDWEHSIEGWTDDGGETESELLLDRGCEFEVTSRACYRRKDGGSEYGKIFRDNPEAELWRIGLRQTK